jgi:hypothetical protein
MFRQWFQYGETEVANNRRAAMYVKNGLKPVGAFIEDCGDCTDLPTVVEGLDEYRTPLLDDAPWVSLEQPDLNDFAGVMIREVTGLEGSTMQVSVEESVGDGGLVGARRATTRTVAVTADLVGRTPEATALGIEWLSAVLHPPCSAGSDCAGDILHMFSTCPVACVGQTDPDAVATSTTYFEAPSFLYNTDNTQVLGPVRGGVCDDVTITWNVSTAVGTMQVRAGWATPGGGPIVLGPVVTVGTASTAVVLKTDSTPGFPDDWRAYLASVDGKPITVQTLVVSHRPVLTVEECVKPYRRTLHNVVTVDGPKVVQWLTLGDSDEGSTVARVEWTWAATDPHVWHDPIPILTTVQGKGTGAAAYKAPGVQLSAAASVAVNATACARPAVTATTCSDNPSGPLITLPPQAPVIPDAGVMDLAGGNRTRRMFEVPAGVAPIGVGKLSWTFVNDALPKFGVRVRIYEDIDPTFTQPSECTFVEEFTIEYLKGGQTLYIDGPGDDVYVYCGLDAFGEPLYASALKNVRGNYGGPFKNSLIGCGKAYFITVDVPNTYSNVPAISGQTTGASQGDLQWSVDLLRRA